MTTFDHLFAVVLVLILPALSAWDVPRLARRIAANPRYERTRDYLWNMTILWGVTLALLGACKWVGRPIGSVGLRLPETASAWWWTLLITGVAIPFFVQQAYSVLKSPDVQAQVRNSSTRSRAFEPSCHRRRGKRVSSTASR